MMHWWAPRRKQWLVCSCFTVEQLSRRLKESHDEEMVVWFLRLRFPPNLGISPVQQLIDILQYRLHRLHTTITCSVIVCVPKVPFMWVRVSYLFGGN